MRFGVGTRLGDLEVVSALGSGGMGEVYLATDLKLGRPVAVKVLREELSTDAEALERFGQEARSVSALNHPNIITIYDIGKFEAMPYIAMELVEGRTLRDILGDGALSFAQILDWARQVASGLAVAHAAGIIHRDLKPENLMVRRDGFVKILDFGLAKLLSGSPGSDHSESRPSFGSSVILGTVSYTSPELAMGLSAEARSDQFSLGCILYEMVTGRLAFRKSTAAQTLSAIVNGDPEPIGRLRLDCPLELASLIERCFAKEPDARYPSSSHLHGELERLHRLESGASLPHSPGSGKAIKSVAVLPLENLDCSARDDYFADGMTEALITDLSRIGALRVISRGSVMRYRSSEKSLPTIARELGVDAIVEGSVLRAGERVRITVELIEAESDRNLWADGYERDLRDVLSLQREVARSISEQIRVKLTPGENELLTRERAVHPGAHDAYLKGRSHLNERSLTSLQKADEQFRRALVADPEYAPAHAGLADLYNTLGLLVLAPPREVMPKAKSAATKALDYDETLAEAHAALASVHLLYDWSFREAEAEIERALELNPSYAPGHLIRAMLLGASNRLPEGMAAVRETLELDPFSVRINNGVAWYLLMLRQYDDALAQCRSTLELQPDSFQAHFCMALTYARKDMYLESMDALKTSLSLRRAHRVVRAIERAYDRSGFEASLVRVARMAAWSSYRYSLSRILPFGRRGYASSVGVAILYAVAGETTDAIRWLQKAFRERDPQLVFLRVSPFWDGVRSHAEFQKLVRRVGLPA